MENLSDAQLKKICVEMTDVQLVNSATAVANIYNVCKEVLEKRKSEPMGLKSPRSPRRSIASAMKSGSMSPRSSRRLALPPPMSSSSMSSPSEESSSLSYGIEDIDSDSLDNGSYNGYNGRKSPRNGSYNGRRNGSYNGYNGSYNSGMNTGSYNSGMNTGMNNSGMNTGSRDYRSSGSYNGYNGGRNPRRYQRNNGYNGYNGYHDNRMGKTLLGAGGGALIGGAVGGPVGLVGGGLLGAGVGSMLNN